MRQAPTSCIVRQHLGQAVGVFPGQACCAPECLCGADAHKFSDRLVQCLKRWLCLSAHRLLNHLRQQCAGTLTVLQRVTPRPGTPRVRARTGRVFPRVVVPHCLAQCFTTRIGQRSPFTLVDAAGKLTG